MEATMAMLAMASLLLAMAFLKLLPFQVVDKDKHPNVQLNEPHTCKDNNKTKRKTQTINNPNGSY
jgi:hypothetical protein